MNWLARKGDYLHVNMLIVKVSVIVAASCCSSALLGRFRYGFEKSFMYIEGLIWLKSESYVVGLHRVNVGV